MTGPPSQRQGPSQPHPAGHSYWKTTPVNACRPFVTGVQQGVAPPPPAGKSVLEAYVLCLTFGVLGAHHFYLGRPCFGILYLFSFGLLGIGWLIDMVRIPCLVRQVNRQNRDKYQQLLTLQSQLAEQRMAQQQQQPGQVIIPINVVFIPFEPKSLADAYILWFPLGIFGFHHFYLRNYGMGFLYLFTLGLAGIGWLVDAFRMPSLVREANSVNPINNKEYSQCTAHILALSPAGMLGGHHYYLNRPVWGLLYTLTLGLLGTGWIWDWCRTALLVKRATAKSHGRVPPNRKYLDEAYVLCFPLGFTGLHHFYLGRYGWGTLYFFTFGIMGIGWLVDLCRLPCLVNEANALQEESCRRLLGTLPAASFTSITDAGSGNPNPAPAPYYGGGQPGVWNPAQLPAGFYPPAPGYGYQTYNQAPAVYPGMSGTYPSYMTPGAGVAYLPQYSAPPAGAGESGPTAVAADVPPSYEASLAAQYKNGTDPGARNV